MPDRGSTTRRRWVPFAAAIGAVALVALALLFFYGRGGGSLPGWLDFLGPEDAGLLEPSSPEEAVLRTLRLAGYDHAVAGTDGDVAVVRLDVPEVRTPADIDLSWQTALGAAAAAWPEADRYVAQVFSDGTAYVEVAIDGDGFRELIETAEGEAEPMHEIELKTRAEITLLPRSGGGDG